MTRTVIRGAGRPTQTPAPCRVRGHVSPSNSSLPMEQTGSASVAP